MDGMSYNEKLRDSRWQKLRLEVMQRDGWKCVICGRGDNGGVTLNVHHLEYNGDPWDTPPERLETLCEDCHGWREEFDRITGLKHYASVSVAGILRILRGEFAGRIVDARDCRIMREGIEYVEINVVPIGKEAA